MPTTCDVKKVIKPTRKSSRLSRKRLSLRPTTGRVRSRFIMSKKPSVKRTNSQLSVAQNATGAPISRCEEQLDATIYRCLHALTKRHQPSDEFRAQFCRGAFLKPNTKAFIQVMHFLLNVYDAREFRKRFYWPIYDKGAENAFRTSTVEYVNHLIERGKLVGMEKIKAHVVVLPGGAKFMKFLLTLIRFVLQEELRRAKAGAGNSEPITKTRIAQMIASHKRLVEVGDRISGTIQEDISVLTEKTRKIETLIETILRPSEVAKQMNYEKLIQMWTILINTQFREQQKIRQRMQTIANEFDRVIEKTESKLKGNELSLPFTQDELKDCLGSYSCQPGTELHQLTQEIFDPNGKLNAIKLLQLFEKLLPNVERLFTGFCMKNPELMKYENKELSKVAVKCDDLRQQLDVLQRSLPMLDECLLRDLPANGDGSPEPLGKDNFAIKNKLFCTPPIVMDFEAQVDDFHTTGHPVGANGRSSHRLALLNKEDVHAMNARMKLLSVSTYQPRSPKPPQRYQKLSADQQLHRQQSNQETMFAVPRLARKEKLNPLTMLNRIKAQSQKQNGLSRSNDGARVNNTMNISTLSEITLRPEFSSTLLGTPEKAGPPAGGNNPVSNYQEDQEKKPTSVQSLQVPPVQSHHVQMKRVISSPNVHSSPRLMAIYAGSNTPKSVHSPNTLLAASGGRRSSMKRSSLIENESTVHTSPSGRLESLVKHDELPQRCSLPLTLDLEKDPISNRDQSGDMSDDKTLKPESGDGVMEDLSSTLLATSADNQMNGAKTEANHKTNSINVLQHVEELDNDNLFNISDGIVTDFE
ncbi:augmin complex subunit dgt6 [Anopheles maculipalpis]|uniref:augmin complex subunit dgt6 n=1 Tax=Anopheles maculipalpis TaxID=1496333 RepID=UPI002158C341|nr:augmin complex subunit dgt6 [Anopheles maculipalpis]